LYRPSWLPQPLPPSKRPQHHNQFGRGPLPQYQGEDRPIAKEEGPPLQEQEEEVAEDPLPLQVVEVVEAVEAVEEVVEVEEAFPL
jgi:hypothetical protein